MCLLSQLDPACRDPHWQTESESRAAAVIHRQTQVHLIVMQMTAGASAAAEPLLFLSTQLDLILNGSLIISAIFFRIFFFFFFFYMWCFMCVVLAMTAERLQKWLFWSVSPPISSRLKYLSNCRMDCQKCWFRHSWFPDDKPSDFSSGDIIKLKS